MHNQSFMKSQIGEICMNSINKNSKEMQMLITLAKEIYESNSYVKKLQQPDSYYKQSIQNTDLVPYSFESIVEMRQKLNELWKDDKQMQGFIPVVLAATFKNRKKSGTDSATLIEHGEKSMSEVLPVYTYTL